jgi:hypothetical protein
VAWDVATGRELLRAGGRAARVTDVEFLPDGQTAVTASRNEVAFWDLTGGGQHARLPVGDGRVMTVTASPDGRRVAASVSDGSVRLIDLERPEHYRAFEAMIATAQGEQPATLDERLEADVLRAFGHWYAFRGVHDWAADFYEGARVAGGEIPYLDVARSYWRLGRLEDARREFAVAADRGEASPLYLRLCMAAVEAERLAVIARMAGSIGPTGK